MLALIGGLIAAGIGLIGSHMQADATKKAASTGVGAAAKATQARLDMYQRTRGDLEPWRSAGAGALSRLSDVSGNMDIADFDFQADPGYQFRLGEGTKALEASAAARGGYFSGGTGKALTQYGQGLASQEYGNAFNRWRQIQEGNASQLYNLANMGLGAAGQAGAMGTTAASGSAQDMLVGGAARAGGIQGQSDAWYGGLQNLSNQIVSGIGNYQKEQYLNKMLPMFKRAPAGAAAAPQPFGPAY